MSSRTDFRATIVGKTGEIPVGGEQELDIPAEASEGARLQIQQLDTNFRDTVQSARERAVALRQTAEQIDQWANELEQSDLPRSLSNWIRFESGLRKHLRKYIQVNPEKKPQS